jgi:hypothetical protein
MLPAGGGGGGQAETESSLALAENVYVILPTPPINLFSGKKFAMECELPEDLIKHGIYQPWTAAECLSNLKQMATFD